MTLTVHACGESVEVDQEYMVNGVRALRCFCLFVAAVLRLLCFSG